MSDEEAMDIRNNDDDSFSLKTRSGRVLGSWHAEIFGRLA